MYFVAKTYVPMVFLMHLDFIDFTQDSDDVTSLSPVSLSNSDESPAEYGESSK